MLPALGLRSLAVAAARMGHRGCVSVRYRATHAVWPGVRRGGRGGGHSPPVSLACESVLAAIVVRFTCDDESVMGLVALLRCVVCVRVRTSDSSCFSVVGCVALGAGASRMSPGVLLVVGSLPKYAIATRNNMIWLSCQPSSPSQR